MPCPAALRTQTTPANSAHTPACSIDARTAMSAAPAQPIIEEQRGVSAAWRRAYAALSDDDGSVVQQDREPGRGGDVQGECFCCLISNRAREVGFAAFRPSTMQLHLAQYVEAGKSTTGVTAMLLRTYDCTAAVILGTSKVQSSVGGPPPPTELPSSAGDASELMQQVRPFLPDEVHMMPRSAFNDTKAKELLEELSTPETWSKVANVGSSSGLYLAFAAAGALLQCLQSRGEHMVLSKTLQVELVGTHAHLRMDAGSLDCLEMLPRPSPLLGVPVTNAAAPPPQHASRGAAARAQAAGDGETGGPLPPATNYKPLLAHRSLLDVMNHTRTSVGARLLRASLLQPLTDVTALNMRYDAVEELRGDSVMACDVARVLTTLPKRLDRLCSVLAESKRVGPTTGKTVDPGRRISACITAVLLLRSALELVPRLAEALSGGQCQLLQAVHTTCSEPLFADMLHRINEVMDTEATAASSALVNRIQQCFAVKSGTDNMLDVARTSFCRLTDQVHQLADQYRTLLSRESNTGRAAVGNRQPPALTLKISYNDRSGFYLAVSHADKTSDSKLDDIVLPRSFISLGKRTRQSVLATTAELNALNARLKDMAHDCLVLTEQVMDGLVMYLTSHMTLLLRLVDNIALTDMLLGFCQLAASAAPGTQFCRPLLLETGQSVSITQGRHPLLERVAGCEVRSNDTTLDGDCSCLHIITGPNMAGKSTYLKQVGLLVVMAQTGSLVPAESMRLRPRTQLFTRMGHGDNIETNSSSFMTEMQEVGHILEHADETSLVLIDELGRATSTLDGVSLCFAVCEALMAARTPTLMATHFPQLTELPDMYPQAKALSMQVSVQGNSLSYSWQLSSVENSTGSQWSYGLALARTLGFPEPLLEHAHRVSVAQLEAQAAAAGARSTAHHGSQATELIRKLLQLAHTARQFADHTDGTDEQTMDEHGNTARITLQGGWSMGVEQAAWLLSELTALQQTLHEHADH